jgi:protein TonB
MVVVNEQGKVVSATPQSTTGVIGQMLSGVATDAARAWRFEPARRNGKPISSTVSLVFRFSN